jgi:hypothetical protein
MIVYYDSTGRVIRATSDEQRLRDGDHLRVPGMPDPEQHFVLDGQLAARPRLVPPPAAAKAGEVIRIDKVPVGTRVIINQQNFGLTDADEPLELDLPLGAWHVELTPPWPWMGGDFRVVVE